MTQQLADAARTLAQLRALQGGGLLRDGGELVPGMFLSIDREQGEVAARFDSAPGLMCQLSVEVTAPGRWLTLNLALGNADLSGLEVIGFWCRTRAPQVVTARAAIRTGLGEGFEDVPFTRHLVAFGDTSTHVDMLQLADFPVLRAEAAWRNLMLGFEPESFALTIEDLRLLAA